MKKTLRNIALALCLGITSSVWAQDVVKATFVSGTDKDGKESADKVVDGHKYTKWCINKEQLMPYTVVLSVGETPIVLKEYILTTGDDTATYPDRNPASWVVCGSNDQQKWTVLDEKHSYLRMAGLNIQDYYFPVKTDKAFKYYRFQFTETQARSELQLSEIQLCK